MASVNFERLNLRRPSPRAGERDREAMEGACPLRTLSAFGRRLVRLKTVAAHPLTPHRRRGERPLRAAAVRSIAAAINRTPRTRGRTPKPYALVLP
jgi:hypothetical protein